MIDVQHWSGAGNLFVIIDDRHKKFVHDQLAVLTPHLCIREQLNMKNAEGVLVLVDAKNSSCEYNFYNPDGSSDVMCGNGARCAVRHCLSLKLVDNTNKINLTLNGRLYQTTLDDLNNVGVHFRPPTKIQHFPSVTLIDDHSPISLTYVDVGSHHLVLDAKEFIQSLNEYQSFNLDKFVLLNMEKLQSIVSMKYFNINLAYAIDDSTIYLRTFENGVNAETGACGTGALSTGATYWSKQNKEIRFVIIPSSQEPLIVHLEIDNDKKITEMILKGDARCSAPPSLFDIATMRYIH